MLESDFSWGSLRLPVGTRVRVVRSGTVCPFNLDNAVCAESLEGLCGSIAPRLSAQPGRYSDAWWTSSWNIGWELGQWQGNDAWESWPRADAHSQESTVTEASFSTAQASHASQASHAAPCYQIVLDKNTQTVLVSAPHVEPILASRVEAQRLMEAALSSEDDDYVQMGGRTWHGWRDAGGWHHRDWQQNRARQHDEAWQHDMHWRQARRGQHNADWQGGGWWQGWHW